MSKKEEYIKKEKQARTIKVKTLVIGLIWFISLVASNIGGWVMRSNFESEVAKRVDYRLEQRELVSKDQ